MIKQIRILIRIFITYIPVLPLIMKKTFVFLLTLIISLKSFACSCECKGDCSFIKISKGSEFVALIKVIEYSDFLDEDISDFFK